MKVDISKVCSDVNFQPRHVVLYCTTTHDWLFPQLMEELRAKFKTKFTLISSISRKKHHKSFLAEKDNILVVEDFELSMSDSDLNEKLDFDTVVNLANHFEKKYGLNYLRDIIQQDRSKLSLLFGNNGINRPKFAGSNDLIFEANSINKTFMHVEKFFEENSDIDFVLIRPADYASVATCAICNSMKVPVSFFHGSYFNLGAQWSAGPYMGNLIIDYIFQKTKLGTQEIPQDTTLVQQWKAPKKATLKLLLGTLIRLFWHRVEFFMIDLKRWNFGAKRASFWKNVSDECRRYKKQIFLDRFTDKNLDKLKRQDYLYFPLPYEPEYTVQSLCRELNDVDFIIRLVALSLPVGMNLLVKEHQRVSLRNKDFYIRLGQIPNVKFVHSTILASDLISGSLGTISLGGSTPVEALKLGKKAFVFGTRNPYNGLPGIYYVEDLRNFAKLLRKELNNTSAKNSSQREIKRFYEIMKMLSFEASQTRLFRDGYKDRLEPEQAAKACELFLLSGRIQTQYYSNGGGVDSNNSC
jgi:hypothetical protein